MLFFGALLDREKGIFSASSGPIVGRLRLELPDHPVLFAIRAAPN